MKLLLIPPARSQANYGQGVFIPTGLLSLAAVLRREEHVTFEIPNVPLFFRDPDAIEAAARQILERAPDVVGFSTWCHSYPGQVLLARAIKRLAPRCWILFGGPHASIADCQTLEAFPWVDLVLRGEAEESLPILLRALSSGAALDDCPGLTWRADGTIRRNADAPPITDLDALPLPAYDLLVDRRTLTVDVGRGCPYNCSYCSTSSFFHRRYRQKSVARVMEELRVISRQYRPQILAFTHDLFTLDRHYVESLCAQITAERLALHWCCMTRIDAVDRPLLQTMARAGCFNIGYGIETGSPRLQRSIRKRLNLTRLREVMRETREAGILASCSFITGFPDEQPEDLNDTLRCIVACARERASVGLNLLAVLPGTSLYTEHAQRLRYDDYSSVTSGAYLSELERDLVRRHPAVFSSFFHLDSPAAPRPVLVGLAQVVFVLSFLKLTLRGVLDTCGLDPDQADLLSLAQTYLLDHLPEGEPVHDAALRAVHSWLRELEAGPWRLPPYLKEVLRAEEASFRLTLAEVETDLSRRFEAQAAEDVAAGGRLYSLRNWTLLASRYPLAEILISLARGEYDDWQPAATETLYAVQMVGENDVRAFSVSPEKAAILNELPHTLTAAELDALCRRHLPPAEAQAFPERLRALQFIAG